MGIEDRKGLSRRDLLIGGATALANALLPEEASAQKDPNRIPLPPRRPKNADQKQGQEPENPKSPEKKSPETNPKLKESQNALLKKLKFTTNGYSIERKDEDEFRKLKPQGLKVVPQDAKIANLHLHAKQGRYSLDGSPRDIRLGRFERALRFKNITDAVERRYNLPPGILMAMLMQESSGSDLFPNGRDDGGIGLIHMQPINAALYGLKTYGNNKSMVDHEHGKALRDLIEQKKSVFELADLDERFNRLLNIDAVGRMLATDIGGNLIAGLGPFRTAIKRYSGKWNYGRYFASLVRFMSDLDDESTVRRVVESFDERNRDLMINGKNPEGSPYAAYLQTFWEENEKGFNLASYRKLPAYRPENSEAALQSYRQFFIKKK